MKRIGNAGSSAARRIRALPVHCQLLLRGVALAQGRKESVVLLRAYYGYCHVCNRAGVPHFGPLGFLEILGQTSPSQLVQVWWSEATRPAGIQIKLREKRERVLRWTREYATHPLSRRRP